MIRAKLLAGLTTAVASLAIAGGTLAPAIGSAAPTPTVRVSGAQGHITVWVSGLGHAPKKCELTRRLDDVATTKQVLGALFPGVYLDLDIYPSAVLEASVEPTSATRVVLRSAQLAPRAHQININCSLPDNDDTDILDRTMTVVVSPF